MKPFMASLAGVAAAPVDRRHRMQAPIAALNAARATPRDASSSTAYRLEAKKSSRASSMPSPPTLSEIEDSLRMKMTPMEMTPTC